MEPQQDRLDPLGLVARALSLVLLAYWALFAVLAPVTTWDSQVYNLGRLPLAQIEGLFDNPLWTSERQLIFPWTFDAIHLPFLHLGWGFGIPSFLCLVGVLVVAWSLLRRWHDATTAWVGCLTLLGLPTVVFQGVGTKNDLPILFGIAVWLYALLAWKDSRRIHHLVLCSLALGFAAGVKTSGIMPAALCAVATLVTLRRDIPAAVAFSTVTLLALVILGSGETYSESYRRYGTPLGQPAFVHAHRNSDGVRGAVANSIRYAMGNLDLGIEAWQHPDRVTPFLEDSCRRILAATALTDAGYRKTDYDDARMRFFKIGFDSASDYGLLGTGCLGTLLCALVWWRPRELWWRLSIFAGTVAAGICYSVAWMPWNNRFLMLPFASLAIALVSLVRHQSGHRRWPLLVVTIASGYSAIAYPLLSFNKKPRDLADSVFRRHIQELKERPTMGPIMAAVRAWQTVNPDQVLWLLAGSDSWVLPFFLDHKLKIRIVNSAELTSELNKSRRRDTYPTLLVLNRLDFKPAGLPLTLVQGFPDENASGLYAYRPPTTGIGRPKVIPAKDFFSDGWTGCYFVVNIADWHDDTVTMSVWNPTPLKRAVSLKSMIETIGLDLEPQQRATVRIRVSAFDSVEGTVSPPFIPGGAETRELGIHISIALP